MTDKQLQKLGRRELLRMLLDQAKETERLSQELTETANQLHQLEETYERLRLRLDSKDAQIHELKTTLQEEREKREVEMQEAGSIAEAALTLNGVFDAAQKAADLYLAQVRALHPSDDVPAPQLPDLTDIMSAQLHQAETEAAEGNRQSVPPEDHTPVPPPAPAPVQPPQSAPPDGGIQAEETAPASRGTQKPPAKKAPPRRLAPSPKKNKAKTEWRFFFGIQRDEGSQS